MYTFELKIWDTSILIACPDPDNSVVPQWAVQLGGRVGGEEGGGGGLYSISKETYCNL